MGNDLPSSDLPVIAKPDIEVVKRHEGWYVRKGNLTWGPSTYLPDWGKDGDTEIADICKKVGIQSAEEETYLRQLLFQSVITSSKHEYNRGSESLQQVNLEGGIEIQPQTKDYVPVHPSFGVVEDTAYVGVWFPCNITYPPKKKDDEAKTVIRDLLFLVTDRRETVLANDEALRGFGWKLAYKPIKLKGSWNLKYVQHYLDGHSSDPVQLYTQALSEWKKFVEFPDEREYILHALWDVGTYFHTIFRTFPYLYCGGIKRSGKTKVLTVHSCLAFNAFFSNNMSTSSIYRLIQNAHGTLLIDESEKLSNPDRALEFRSILLSGYKRSSVVYRIEKTKKEMLVPEAFEIYSPKSLANIQGIEDVLEDRAISTIMKRGKNRRITDREIDTDSEYWSELRSELTVLFLEHWRDIQVIYDRISECSELTELVNLLRVPQKIDEMGLLTARELELWKPIFVIAKYFDGVLPMFTDSSSSLCSQMMSLALEKAEQKQTENMTETGEVILAQILCLLVTTNDYYKVKDIRDEMAKQFDEEQKWLNTRWVGNALRRIGFTNKRRVGTGYEYYLTPEAVRDTGERLGIDQKILGDQKESALDSFLPSETRKENEPVDEITVRSFTLDKVAGLPEFNRQKYQGLCHYCGKKTIIVAAVETYEHERFFVCEDCRQLINKELSSATSVVLRQTLELEERDKSEKVTKEPKKVDTTPISFSGIVPSQIVSILPLNLEGIGECGNCFLKPEKLTHSVETTDGKTVLVCSRCAEQLEGERRN
jgi:transcription elongation factor Elf1